MSARPPPSPTPKNTLTSSPPKTVHRPNPLAGRVYTIAAGEPFAATLVRGLKTRYGADPARLAEAVIYLPTQRAARAFAAVFAAEMGGATLLPEFRPLNAADEDELLPDPAAEDLSLPPAIAPLRRIMLLAALVRRWNQNRDGGTMSFVQAAGLAGSLAVILDEIETAGADWAALQDLAPAELAAHWAAVKDFLEQVHAAWPALLAAEGCADPADRRNQALTALAARIRAGTGGIGIDRPVIAAGSTGSIPATAHLMAAIASQPLGAIVLPGLDRTLDGESWDRLDPGHPQYGMKQLLTRLELSRADVEDWIAAKPSPRAALLSETMRPAPTTDAWRALAETGAGKMAEGLKGLSLVVAADPAEEADIIALALRETLESPGKTAGLITRDRALARRVAAACRRWGLTIDDTAGRPLSHTPPGAFLCLLAEAADAGFSPVALLALLKHPLCALQTDEAADSPTADAAAFRRMARRLDLSLRGPAPDAGLDGIARHLTRLQEETGREDAVLASWFERVRAALTPLEAALGPAEVDLSAVLQAFLEAAAALSAPGELWRGPAGEAAKIFFDALAPAVEGLPAVEASAFAPLLRQLMGRAPVRPAFGSHPRLAILGPLEARLLSFDRTILGGLNEGVWPAAAGADPWFSRPMRRTLGLEQPERAIGLSAHDFAGAAAGGEVLLTRAAKADGTPTVASRWLQRLEQLTKGLGLVGRLEPATPYRDIVRALNETAVQAPMAPPAPTPAAATRPRKLSVTEIETWLRDPYAIYAKHILRLRPLDPLEADIGPLERGSILHRALELFVRRYPRALPEDAAAKLIAIADEVFAEERTPKAVAALWRPRFVRAAHWFVAEERQRRGRVAETFVEISGQTVLPAPGGAFTLTGKADRIDRLKTGGCAILDYKTGAPPSGEMVETLLSPQLPLEGAILSLGGFSDIGPSVPVSFEYVRIGGGDPPGEVRPVGSDAVKLANEALAKLAKRVADFDRDDMAYRCRLAPQFARAQGDYDHLARVGEWSDNGWNRS